MLHFWYFFILFINKPALMVSRHTYIGLLHEMLTRHLKVTTQKLIEVTKGGYLMKHCKLLFSENMHSDWLKLIMWFSTSNHKGFFPEYLYFLRDWLQVLICSNKFRRNWRRQTARKHLLLLLSRLGFSWLELVTWKESISLQ